MSAIGRLAVRSDSDFGSGDRSFFNCDQPVTLQIYIELVAMRDHVSGHVDLAGASDAELRTAACRNDRSAIGFITGNGAIP